MSTKNKNPLDALFAEAVNAVEKVQEETSEGSEEFEIEFVDETSPPSADEVEFEVDLDMDEEAADVSVFEDLPHNKIRDIYFADNHNLRFSMGLPFVRGHYSEIGFEKISDSISLSLQNILSNN